MNGVNDSADHTLLKQVRLMALAEATTLTLLLGIAVPLKHFAGWPMGVRLMGPIHGLAFLGYAWTLLKSTSAGVLRSNGMPLLIASAFIPFAGFMTAFELSRRINNPSDDRHDS